MAESSAAPKSSAMAPAIVVVGHGPVAEALATTLAGQQASGGAPVTHLVTPPSVPTLAAPFACPLPELAGLPGRPDYPLADALRLEGTPTAITRQGEGFLLTLADGGTLPASQLVLLSSSLAGKLLPTLGLALPLRPARAHRLLFNGVTLPAPQSENLGYGTVLAYTEGADTTLFYDGLADPSQATFDLQPDPRVTEALSQWLAPHLSNLTDTALPPPVTTAQRLTTTPDYLPALGPWPGVPGLWLAVGLAGWGPILAPGLAALFTTTFRGQAWPASLAFVSPARFRDGNANPVARPQWLVERQPVVIGPQFAATVRLIGGRAQRVNGDADVQLTGSSLNADVANTVNFKQSKTVTRAGDAEAGVGRPLVDKSKPRAAPVRSK